MLRRFFRDVFKGTDPALRFEMNIASFVLLCDVLDILSLCTVERCTAATAARLRVATKKWLDKHLEVYGDAWWVFKHHQPLHIVEMCEKFGFLVSAFTMERKHKDSKRVCTDHLNTVEYEKSIMEELVLSCFNSWSTDDEAGMQGGREAPKKMFEQLRELAPSVKSICVAREYATEDGRRFYQNDVAMLEGGEFAEIWFHCRFDSGEPHSCVSVWPTLTSQSALRVAQCSVRADPKLIPSRLLLHAVTFKTRGEVATVLLPPAV